MTDRRPRRLAAPLLLAMAVGLLLPFGGCGLDDGGTSSGTGNPELLIRFRQDGKPVDYEGALRVYAGGSDPLFHTPGAPTDPTASAAPVATIHIGRSALTHTNYIRYLGSHGRIFLDWDFMETAGAYRLALPHVPPHVDDEDPASSRSEGGKIAPGDSLNLAFDLQGGGATAFVRGLVVPKKGEKHYRDAAGAPVETLWVDLVPPGAYTGSIDTAGLGDTPLVLYSPGSPYYARIHGGRFHLEGMPVAPLPVRLVTARGNVHPFAAPVDVKSERGQYVPDTLPPLVPGARTDSFALPPALEVLAAPIATPAGPHQFTDSLVVALSAGPGAVIRYTLDGSTPGGHSSQYAKPLVLRASATLKAAAYRAGAHHSAVAVNNYALVPSAPRVSPASQAFRDSLRVALTATAAGATIHYTLDGSEPGGASPVYAAPLLIEETTTLKAVASVPGLGLSRVAEERYIRVPDTLAAVAPPEAAPPGGSFADSVTVALSAAAQGGSIHYTLDGSEPASQSPRYEQPFVLKAPATVKAVTIRAGSRSAVATWTFTAP